MDKSTQLEQWQAMAEKGESAKGSGPAVVAWYEANYPSAETLLYMLAYALDALESK